MRRIALSGKYGEGKYALVSDEDYESLVGYSWYCHRAGDGRGYAERRHGNNHYKMHRVILKAPADMLVDHKNGDTLDNRRDNIRLCTPSQNAYNKTQRNNKSGYKGVFKDNRNRRKYKIWYASITVEGKLISLGHYYTAEEAAKVYKAAAERYHGEFAKH